jgi:methylated-DNA-[protein]-cysteine S-methyltransferase
MRAPTATARINSPIGVISMTATYAALTSIRILPREIGEMLANDHPVLVAVVRQMRAYFAGELMCFDLPLAPLDSEEGALLRHGIASIPYGETRTYGALAAETGSIARAVGQACKTNPFPIVIPCHRVVSTSGPEYYSGGDGPRTKTWLNDFEYDHLPPERRTRLL